MTEETRKKRRSTGTGTDSEMVTLSTRVDGTGESLVSLAARTLGWSPAQFLREAALEKAAHVLNLRTQTRFDFKKLAQATADQLVAAEPILPAGDPEGFVDEVEQYFRENTCASRFDPGQISQLKEAVRLGGTEFLRLVLDYCEAAQSPAAKDLPEPLDPKGFMARSEKPR